MIQLHIHIQYQLCERAFIMIENDGDNKLVTIKRRRYNYKA